MDLKLYQAIEIANQAVLTKFYRSLTDVEIIVIKGAWERQEYSQIASKHNYTTSYISQDIAPKLWKLLTEAIGEKVKKSNFKEALKRYWEKQCWHKQFTDEYYLLSQAKHSLLNTKLYIECNLKIIIINNIMYFKMHKDINK